MKDLFIGLLDFTEGIGNTIEALMYSGSDFSRIKVETESGTYAISISKENENTGTREKENE